MNRPHKRSAQEFLGHGSQQSPPQPRYPIDQSSMNGTPSQQQQRTALPGPAGNSTTALDDDHASRHTKKKKTTSTTEKATTEPKGPGPKIGSACDQCRRDNKSRCFGWHCQRCAKDKLMCTPTGQGLAECKECREKMVICTGIGKQCDNCTTLNRTCTYGRVLGFKAGLANNPDANHILAAVIRSNPEIEKLILAELQNKKAPGTDLSNLDYLAKMNKQWQAGLSKTWNQSETKKLVDSACDRTIDQLVKKYSTETGFGDDGGAAGPRNRVSEDLQDEPPQDDLPQEVPPHTGSKTSAKDVRPPNPPSTEDLGQPDVAPRNPIRNDPNGHVVPSTDTLPPATSTSRVTPSDGHIGNAARANAIDDSWFRPLEDMPPTEFDSLIIAAYGPSSNTSTKSGGDTSS
ncbi:hypothetical protein F4805DRAFT_45351 [Annulohypoxylon moriforme]|nr:hypothetical protein F4805DRAFT_45351 [Annulohypoxylon moriforme]